MSIEKMRGVDEMERVLAERYLLARLIREVRVLRELVKAVPATATMACNVCFRPFPHSEKIHANDEHFLSQLPEDRFDASGFVRASGVARP